VISSGSGVGSSRFARMDVVRLEWTTCWRQSTCIDCTSYRSGMLSIVRAAVISGCRTLYTEDLQDGRRFESLQIVNPFRAVDDDSSG